MYCYFNSLGEVYINVIVFVLYNLVLKVGFWDESNKIFEIFRYIFILNINCFFLFGILVGLKENQKMF